MTDYLSPSGTPNHGGNNFEVFALNLSDGSLVAGYPLIYTQSLLDAVNQNYLASPTHPIATATVSAGVVTITTTAPNGFSAGQTAVIAGVGSGYDGTFTIVGVNANNNTFTYSDANASGTVMNSGTALTKIAVVFSSSGADQRGALKLNADGSTLYVDFACYGASNGGWMTAVATGVTNGALNGQTPAIVSAYSAIDNTTVIANGGMWGAGGPVIDANGNVFVTTGDSPPDSGNPPGDWGNSVLEWGPGQTLTLTGVYTPWNFENQDTIDSDMGGGSPILITLPDGSSTTTELLATGGKQGNGYLLDAGNNLNNPTPNPNNSPASYPASLIQRPPATESPDQDASLYELGAAGIRTYWTKNNQGQTVGPQDGPLALFGPYNESSASGNTAKARDTPATFTGPDGNQYIIWAGATKAGVGSSTPVAPSLIETEIVHSAGQPAYLQIVAQNTAVMSNPGSNLITGNGTSNEIDWVVDEGQQRTDGTTSFSDGSSVLYAYNALTLQPLWNSAYEELDVPDGKYNSIAVARGDVYVGTNRIQAFGLTTNTIVDDSVAGSGTNQFNYVGSGWTHVTGSSTMGTFDGTVSTDNVQGDYATMQFTGSAISVYANELTTYGTATFSIDGGNTQTVTLSPANSSPNGAGAGNVLVFTMSGLSAGTHTLKILNNAASNVISIDRVQITPPATTHASLGISMTDGNVVPVAMGVVPYTINYTNAGSIVKSTGVNATGVVITETVQANTTADLANSTPGWTLVSGSGGAGSVYTFAVGNLNAGVTGSVVFSVDLNASIPLGTTTVSDDVSISDAASDLASATRTTPIPPPAESQLIFSQEPPANGSAGIRPQSGGDRERRRPIRQHLHGRQLIDRSIDAQRRHFLGRRRHRHGDGRERRGDFQHFGDHVFRHLHADGDRRRIERRQFQFVFHREFREARILATADPDHRRRRHRPVHHRGRRRSIRQYDRHGCVDRDSDDQSRVVRQWQHDGGRTGRQRCGHIQQPGHRRHQQLHAGRHRRRPPTGEIQFVQYRGDSLAACLYPAAQRHLPWRGRQSLRGRRFGGPIRQYRDRRHIECDVDAQRRHVLRRRHDRVRRRHQRRRQLRQSRCHRDGNVLPHRHGLEPAIDRFESVRDRDPCVDDDRRRQRQQLGYDSPGRLLRRLGAIVDARCQTTSAAP